MNIYYIAFEKHQNQNVYAKSWVIRRTPNDMDTSEGLQKEIMDLEAESGCPVWLINWKRLAPNKALELDGQKAARHSA